MSPQNQKKKIIIFWLNKLGLGILKDKNNNIALHYNI